MEIKDIPKITFKTHEGHYEFLAMHFVICNVPSTFQGLMNSIFKHFPRKFMLIFFYDILIYKNSWKDHVQHVEKVLKLLDKIQLHAKPSKIFFRVHELECSSTIVSHEGFKVNPKKIKSIREWKIPITIRHLQVFLI